MIALLKLIAIFTGIITLLARKWDLGVVLLLATLAVAVLFSYPLLNVGRDALTASIDPLTLRLAVIVVLVIVLSGLMRRAGALKGMVESLQRLVPDGRLVIIALPALIGLLPMIGGAMFSAPMVDEAGERLGITQGRKTFVNYWFRHIWEPIFPLYPSMMLAAALLDLTPRQLASAAWPVMVTTTAGGVFFGLVGLPRRPVGGPEARCRAESARLLAGSIWPIALAVVLGLTLNVDERLNMIIGLLVTIASTLILKRIPLRELWTILHKHVPWRTVLIIFGALIFRRVLEMSGAIEAVSSEMADLHIPLAIVAFALPFMVGALTGVMAAAFSIGFSVILPLISTDGSALSLGWVNWLMAAGFMGAMCSPMHLCLGLTKEYFRAEWGTVYRYIVPAALLTLITASVILAFTR